MLDAFAEAAAGAKNPDLRSLLFRTILFAGPDENSVDFVFESPEQASLSLLEEEYRGSTRTVKLSAIPAETQKYLPVENVVVTIVWSDDAGEPID